MSDRPGAFVWLVATLLGLGVHAGPVAAQDTAQRYQDACDDGQVAACALLGLMLERGAGVPRNVERAAGLYERACEGGELRGCTNLGLLYESGTGVTRDLSRAQSLYRRACDAGETQGCDLLETAERRAAVEAGGYAKVGRVEDAANGSGLAQAVVEIPALGVRVISDAQGRVDLGRLPAGRHGLVAYRFGFESVSGLVDVPGTELVIQMPRAGFDDPLEPGEIAGRVLGTDGQGLAAVEVSAEAEGARALSNAQGRFTLRGVDPGLVELRWDLLGYASRTTQVVLQPGGKVEVTATLSTEAIELAPILVSVPSSWLDRMGFYGRAAQGWGTHLGPEDIARIDPAWTSDLVRGIPGIQVRTGRGGTMYAESRRGSSFNLGPCRLPVYVDGIIANPDLDDLPPQWIEAMEIYHGVGTPIQYGNGCGAVLIWTNR